MNATEEKSRMGGQVRGNLPFLLIGSGIGAVVALLFAPKPGAEFRGDLSQATKRGVENAKGHARRIKSGRGGVGLPPQADASASGSGRGLRGQASTDADEADGELLELTDAVTRQPTASRSA